MKIVIVGGVAGGASAAARARRLSETAEILLLQSGPDVSFASCGMPYFIGGEITNRQAMAVQTPTSLHNRLNITVKVMQRVTAIDTAQKQLTVTNEADQTTYTESYDELILAVGASPLKPPIAGIDRPGLFALRNLTDMVSLLIIVRMIFGISCFFSGLLSHDDNILSLFLYHRRTRLSRGSTKRKYSTPLLRAPALSGWKWSNSSSTATSKSHWSK